MSSSLNDSSAQRTPLGQQLMRRKTLGLMAQESADNEGMGQLKRSLSVTQLVMISVGATLGTGILVILGAAVPEAGPGTWLAFVIAGITALLCAVSYAEMAGMVPMSGSSYSYSYATLGEGVAWICGWCLVLEYAVSAAAVAVGTGEYVNQTLGIFGLSVPETLAAGPAEGGIINLPALLVVVLATVMLMRGAKESAMANTIMVIVKIAILFFFVIVAFTAFDAKNFTPLMPMGMAGVSGAASMVFFSYIGFDAASTAGEEAKNPQRDLPRAILIAMAIGTTLGMDPVHLGVMVVFNVLIGFVTPPVGLCLFVIAGVTGRPIEKISLKALPMIGLALIVLAIIALVPDVVLLLMG